MHMASGSGLPEVVAVTPSVTRRGARPASVVGQRPTDQRPPNRPPPLRAFQHRRFLTQSPPRLCAGVPGPVSDSDARARLAVAGQARPCGRGAPAVTHSAAPRLRSGLALPAAPLDWRCDAVPPPATSKGRTALAPSRDSEGAMSEGSERRAGQRQKANALVHIY